MGEILQVDVVALRIRPTGGKRWIGPEIPAYQRGAGVIEEDEKRIAQGRYRGDDRADVLFDAQTNLNAGQIPWSRSD